MCQANSPAREDVHRCGPHSKSNPGYKDRTKVSKAPPFDRTEVIVILVCGLSSAFLFGVWLMALTNELLASTAKVPPPNFLIRLVGVEGLDPGTLPPEPPAFHLAVNVDGLSRRYQACSGGGNSMLRVSYHGMILAWGQVPRFCIDGGRRGNGVVVTVVAKAEGAVLREEVRGLVLSDQRDLGKAEFDVEGEVAGLGYLRCKAFLLEGKATEAKAICQVQ